MTRCDYGDVVLVPFPFTDQTATKRRPAVVISSAAYHRERSDVIILAVTSHASDGLGFAEEPVSAWRAAGLIRPSLFKPVVATLLQGRILRALGALSAADRVRLGGILRQVLGA